MLRIFILIVLISFAGISTVSAEESEGGQLDIVEKVVDHDYVDFYFLGKLHLPKFDPVHVGPLVIDFSITKTLFMMFLVSIFSVLLLTFAAKSNVRNKAPKGVGNFVEIIIVFIRDEIVLPNMGKEGLRLLPYFLSLFFFILFSNLFGLIPFMAQPTKNLSVTTALALLTFFITQIEGMKKNGVIGYFKGLVPHGIPGFVLPVMIIVEFIGLFTKPFALLMRLFANITAGSIIILSLLGLIFVMSYAGIAIALPFTLFIYCLELFIALLQAYIFTMLSVLFVSMAMHQDH
ncbi:MAG: F0F1 ATP synthase subunit A [Ignavibacteriaceae bacterium]|nr:MAG: ATP synthase F0 subunit A [Chlorobiota bacterium]MCE7953829.1 ATP synthase F0 subunit A [Chlorobi bacterium CHB7]MDL1887763.1 F0F1 ATP synthase subunit A [Ignavibacteria bacterium CHB1]MEB2330385.1 F0F1 ATP synthase subunit A [Ignavibacteriaceae bacterium]RIK48309.1 MAG: ATP synthase F0 subunit A [Ignavibacteriota bacterium]